MKTIKELSESFKISKESIYKKVNYSLKVELKDHVFKNDGKTFIDEIGESLIAQSLKKERTQDQNQSIVTPLSTNNLTSNEPINELENQVKNADLIVLLKAQLAQKDLQLESLTNLHNNQLKSKDEQIEQLLRINQSLVDTFQNEQKIKITTTLLTDKENILATDGEQLCSPKRSFWQRLFNI